MSLDDLQKSIKAILYDRVSSPFWGTFVLTWSVWNWRIIHLTLFVSEKNLPINKTQYICENYLGKGLLFFYPLVSTILLLTVIPIFTNIFFKISLRHRAKRRSVKLEVEGEEVLTLDQSIKLRSQLKKADEELKKTEKNIEGLENQLNAFSAKIVNLENELTEEKQKNANLPLPNTGVKDIANNLTKVDHSIAKSYFKQIKTNQIHNRTVHENEIYQRVKKLFSKGRGWGYNIYMNVEKQRHTILTKQLFKEIIICKGESISVFKGYNFGVKSVGELITIAKEMEIEIEEEVKEKFLETYLLLLKRGDLQAKPAAEEEIKEYYQKLEVVISRLDNDFDGLVK